MYKGCGKFYEAIQKLGWDDFIPIILEENLSYYQAQLSERKWIATLDCVNNGYNIDLGGFGKDKHSERTLEKISNKLRGIKRSDDFKKHLSEIRTGWIFSEETKLKISKSLTGRKLSESHIKNISESHKGHSSWNKGLKMSEEYKNKLRMSHRNKIPVRQIDNQGVVLAVYESIHEANRVTGIRDGNISRCVNGKIKTAGGYHWEFADDTKN